MASDGKNLRLYQAVVDARKLLDELSDPETSVSRNKPVAAKERIYLVAEHLILKCSGLQKSDFVGLKSLFVHSLGQ